MSNELSDLILIIDTLSETEKQVLLAMTMESLRGSWSNFKERIALVKTLCESITGLPFEYLSAVKHNANEFDGCFTDGRIFRDGSRTSGLSGNLAFLVTGDDQINQSGYYGTYGELWTMLEKVPDLESVKRKMYNTILTHTSDLTWGDYVN